MGASITTLQSHLQYQMHHCSVLMLVPYRPLYGRQPQQDEESLQQKHRREDEGTVLKVSTANPAQHQDQTTTVFIFFCINDHLLTCKHGIDIFTECM